jgi:peptide chain release factor 3
LHKACWLESDNAVQLKELQNRKRNDIAVDKDGKLVFLAESAWILKLTRENYPEVKFHFSSEF